MWQSLFGSIAVIISVILFSLWAIRFRFVQARRKEFVVAFFHPYSNDGGGGERVLWCCVKALQELNEHAKCVIYTGQEKNIREPKEILERVKNHFNIILNRDVEFIFLKKRWLVEDKTWKRFTLLGQSLGSMILGWEALTRLTPHVYIDTMGYAFTYPIFKIFGGCKIACYVHYPTISTDMLSRIAEQRPSYNNDERISKSIARTQLKMMYYRLFAHLYSFMGSFSQVVMVNSSWTSNHINSLWKIPNRTSVVYPPCNTTALQELPLQPRETVIISIGQFRPEKDHTLQLESFNVFLKKNPKWKGKIKLVLIGSSRNEEDATRVQKLKDRAKELSIEDDITFEVNVSYDKLRLWLSKALIGVHTMWNEHFGIGIVEFMAAGVIPIAHKSGGPKEDIVIDFQGHPTGFLAAIEEEYSQQIERILSMNEDRRNEIQKNARKSASRFSDEEFASRFKNCIGQLLPSDKKKK